MSNDARKAVVFFTAVAIVIIAVTSALSFAATGNKEVFAVSLVSLGALIIALTTFA